MERSQEATLPSSKLVRDNTELLVRRLVIRSRLAGEKEEFLLERHLIEYKNGKPIRAIIGIPTTGCNYARLNGACSMCGHPDSGLWDINLTDDTIIELFQSSIEKIRPMKPNSLGVYCSGSFFDDNEVSVKLKQRICKSIADEAWIEEVVVESLPQYITKPKIEAVQRMLGSIRLKIGISLETANQFIRSSVLLKKVPSLSYIKATEACGELKNVYSIAYAVIKPPFLTEGEAIWEGAETIHSAVMMKFDEISLEPLSLQSGTLQSLLEKQGHYDMSSIWTLVNILKLWQSKYPSDLNSITIKIGGEVYTPLPYKTFLRCSTCENKAFKELEKIGVEIDLPRISIDNPDGQCDTQCCTYIEPNPLEIREPNPSAVTQRVIKIINLIN